MKSKYRRQLKQIERWLQNSEDHLKTTKYYGLSQDLKTLIATTAVSDPAYEILVFLRGSISEMVEWGVLHGMKRQQATYRAHRQFVIWIMYDAKCPICGRIEKNQKCWIIRPPHFVGCSSCHARRRPDGLCPTWLESFGTQLRESKFQNEIYRRVKALEE